MAFAEAVGYECGPHLTRGRNRAHMAGDAVQRRSRPRTRWQDSRRATARRRLNRDRNAAWQRNGNIPTELNWFELIETGRLNPREINRNRPHRIRDVVLRRGHTFTSEGLTVRAASLDQMRASSAPPCLPRKISSRRPHLRSGWMMRARSAGRPHCSGMPRRSSDGAYGAGGAVGISERIEWHRGSPNRLPRVTTPGPLFPAFAPE